MVNRPVASRLRRGHEFGGVPGIGSWRQDTFAGELVGDSSQSSSPRSATARAHATPLLRTCAFCITSRRSSDERVW